MATATDDNGNLIPDGQMIVVGSWDIANKKIRDPSNKAGTVCTTYVNDTCKDAAEIKDFYILFQVQVFTVQTTMVMVTCICQVLVWRLQS